MRVRSGLDHLLERLGDGSLSLGGRRYGLLGHGASVTHDLRPAHLALAASPAGPAAVLFGPEHGYYGVEQDMVAAATGKDPWTGAPLLSLYGDDEQSLRPASSAFDDLDLLIIDLQDVGSRYYTYAATAIWAAEVALQVGCEVWVLDRPNPLGGERIEGGLLRPGFESFVGAFELPARHGLTLGELVRLEARRRGWESDGGENGDSEDRLKIWTATGWRRDLRWHQTGMPWIAPSPNMPTETTALIYPGGCLIEATTLSEGRGTTRPFQLIGAPGLDPLALVAELQAQDLAGVSFVPTYFRPQFQKHAGARCGGVEVVVTDADLLQPYRLGVELVWACAKVGGEAFGWRAEPYEFVIDQPAIDLLTSSKALRLAVVEQDRSVLEEWMASWAADESAFREEVRDILLYPEGTA